MREETRCRHMGYSFRLTARVLLYAPSQRQDSTYHDLWYTSRGALAETRNSSMGPPHEGSTRRPIAPWANALTTELHLALTCYNDRTKGGPYNEAWLDTDNSFILIASGYLFLEVSNGILVCEGEEVKYAMSYVVILEVIHHVSSVTLETNTHV